MSRLFVRVVAGAKRRDVELGIDLKLMRTVSVELVKQLSDRGDASVRIVVKSLSLIVEDR